MNQITEDKSKANNHRNDENIRRIIFIGESEIVNINIARGIPNARKTQPKNSATVMIAANHLILSQILY
jgi:hypothetical protein